MPPSVDDVSLMTTVPLKNGLKKTALIITRLQESWYWFKNQS